MTKELPLQLSHVDKIKDLTLSWAKSADIKLHNIETVVPFVLTDKSLDVWFFFDTDQLVQTYTKNGVIDSVKQKYLDFLKTDNYPADYLAQVTFTVDSYENVLKNFEGSYFYRLR
jgi:hypothetical protein